MILEPIASAFEWATAASLGAAVLILFGLILFILFPRVFGPRWRFAFGVIVLVRLMLPLSIESRFSFHNWWNFKSSDPPAVSLSSSASDFSAEKPAGSPDLKTPVPFGELPTFRQLPAFAERLPDFAPRVPVIPRPSAAQFPISGFGLIESLGLIWIAGVFGFSAVLFFRYFRLKRWIARHRQGSEAGSRLPLLLEQTCATLGIRRPIPLVVVPRLKSAAVFGWRRPRLLVGEDFTESFSDAEIRGILLHELAHVRRHDVLWNWLAQAALAFHWFNPLVWLAVRRFQADREQICDRLAMDHLSPRQRRHYGEALLASLCRLPGSPSGNFPVPSLAPFFTRKSEIKNRIAMINRKQKNTSWIWHLLAVIAIAGAGAVTFTTALADNEEKDEKPEIRTERRETVKKVHRDTKDDLPGLRDRRIRPDQPRPERRDDEGDRPGPDGERDRPDQPRAERRDDEGDRPGPKGERDRPDQPRPERRDDEGDRPGPKGERDKPRPHGDMPPELREFAEQVHRLQREVHELARAGKHDEAEEREKKVRHLMSERPELAERFHQHQRLRENREIEDHRRELIEVAEKAARDGNEEEFKRTRAELHKIENAVNRRDEGENLERRIHHLRQAAENLEEVGLHDQARKLHEQAEEAERDLRNRENEHRGNDLERHAENLEREVHELREVVGDLREEIEKLKNQLRERD